MIVLLFDVVIYTLVAAGLLWALMDWLENRRPR